MRKRVPVRWMCVMCTEPKCPKKFSIKYFLQIFSSEHQNIYFRFRILSRCSNSKNFFFFLMKIKTQSMLFKIIFVYESLLAHGKYLSHFLWKKKIEWINWNRSFHVWVVCLAIELSPVIHKHNTHLTIWSTDKQAIGEWSSVWKKKRKKKQKKKYIISSTNNDGEHRGLHYCASYSLCFFSSCPCFVKFSLIRPFFFPSHLLNYYSHYTFSLCMHACMHSSSTTTTIINLNKQSTRLL